MATSRTTPAGSTGPCPTTRYTPSSTTSSDPEAVRQLKASAECDLTVGGPDLAGHVFMAGLVDECHLFVAPVVVGGGKQSLPDNVRLQLELLDERRFGSGMVHLYYRTRRTR